MEFHNMQISDHRYLEKVFKNLRQKLNLAEEAPILGLKANVLIWGLFMSGTMKAAIHLGPSYIENLEVYRNTNFEELKNLFDFTQRLIFDHQAEILNVSTIDWKVSSWTTSTLTHDQDESKSTCLLRFCLMLGEDARSFRSKPKMDCSTRRIRQSNSHRVLFGIDGEPIEFEWNMFPGLTSLEIFQKVQKNLQDQNIEPEHFEG